MGEHAKHSPSAAERWMTCPGSVSLESHFPDETSEAAAEGSAAHTVREQCLRNGIDVADLVGETVTHEGYTFTVTEDWARFLQPGIDLLRELPGELYIEYRVDLGAWMPGDFGTLDAGVITGPSVDDEIVINDLKFGRGVIVSAVHNKQLMLYAAGFWENVARLKTKATRFRLMIDQPRGIRADAETEWVTDLATILKFAEEAAIAVRATEDPDAPLRVSPKGCQFCKGLSNAACPEIHSFCADLVGLDPDSTSLTEEPELADIDQLSPERRSFVVEHAAIFKKWLEAVHGLHLQKALAGEPTPGYKAVATLGDRTWADPEAAEAYWKSKMPAKDIYSMKLKSPAQMEAVAGTRNWAKAQELIHRPEGRPALVPVSDKREALTPLRDLLDDLDDEGNVITEVSDLDDLI